MKLLGREPLLCNTQLSSVIRDDGWHSELLIWRSRLCYFVLRVSVTVRRHTFLRTSSLSACQVLFLLFQYVAICTSYPNIPQALCRLSMFPKI